MCARAGVGCTVRGGGGVGVGGGGGGVCFFF